MIVIPAPPGSQVRTYVDDPGEGRTIVARDICAVLLSDGDRHGSTAPRITHAVPVMGSSVLLAPGVAWITWGLLP